MSHKTNQTTKSETPLLTQSTAGFSIFYCGKDLYGPNPIELANTKASKIPLVDETLYIVCSPLLWYGVETLLQQLPLRSIVVVIELDPILADLSNQYISNLSPKIATDSKLIFLHHLSKNDYALAISTFFNRGIRRIQSLSLNAGRMLDSSGYQTIQRKAEAELMRFWRNQSTLMFMGRLWMRNLYQNIAHSTQFMDIALIARHPAVVICGAGPSLEETIPFITQFRDMLFIVCVDTAIPILSAHRLIPDLIIAVESQLANMQDFIPAGLNQPAIAYDITSCPIIPRHFNFKQQWVFTSIFAPGKHWNILQQHKLLPTSIPPLGSVGVVALYLCLYMASNCVYITGLDFSWKPGLSHARGSPNQLRQLTTMSRHVGTMGELGSLSEHVLLTLDLQKRVCITDKTLSSYRDSTEEVIELLVSEGLDIVDLREYGLPLSPLVRRKRDTEIPPNQASIQTVSNNVSHSTKPSKNSIIDYLQQEKDKIRDIHLQTEQFLQNPEYIDQEKLLSQLQELDYLFHEIPDRDWPNLKSATLSRAWVILEYYETIIDKRLIEISRS